MGILSTTEKFYAYSLPKSTFSRTAFRIHLKVNLITHTFLLSLFAITFLPVGIAQGDMVTKRKYIEQFKWIALKEMELTGIPASIKLAQGLLESNAGFSTLATEANNHFGMKCHNDWSGLTFYKVDDDRDAKGNLIPSCFRKFSSPEESYHAHSLWLTQKSRYNSLFTLEPNDYKGWAHGLKKAGYATDPAYGEKLISIIEKFELHKILPEPSPVAPTLSLKAETKKDLKKIMLEKESVKTEAQTDKSQSGVWMMNKVRFVYAENGLSLSEISALSEVSTKKIMKINPHLSSKTGNSVSKNPRIYLERKRKSFHGDQKWHLVKPGESMYTIADYYAVQIEPLRKRNKLFEHEEPTIGTKLKLRGKKIRVATTGK